jgi:hypothetical protein
MSFASTVRRGVFVGAAFMGGAFAIAACQQGMMPTETLADAEYGLHYVDADGTAKLAYGKTDSEILSLMLECRKGSGLVQITDVAHGDNRLVLKADGRRSDLPARVESSPGAPILAAEAQADAPALAGFRETGKVEVTNGPVRYDVEADTDERASVERFFTACETA